MNYNWVVTHWQWLIYVYRERNIHNNKKMCEVRTVLRLCDLYPGICLTTEEKARKNLS
jgi:hypothetical protein